MWFISFRLLLWNARRCWPKYPDSDSEIRQSFWMSALWPLVLPLSFVIWHPLEPKEQKPAKFLRKIGGAK
jgi:hypothetical protein